MLPEVPQTPVDSAIDGLYNIVGPVQVKPEFFLWVIFIVILVCLASDKKGGGK